MLLNRLRPVTCLLLLLLLASAVRADELKTIKAKDLELKVPGAWKEVRSTSRFRLAQFEIAGKEGAKAELVVFHFGGSTGGIKRNVDRWIGQFKADGRKVKLTRGDGASGPCILADVSGTWKKPDGPPFAQKTIDTPNSRVINAIVIKGEGDDADFYFLKLSGPDKLVQGEAAALRQAIGLKAPTEKPFDLKQAEN